MEKKTLFAGLGVLMILGLVLATSAAFDRSSLGLQGMRGNHAIMRQDLGLSENATGEDVREAMFDKRIRDLGLSENSTLKELKAALITRMQKLLGNMPSPPGNATSRRIRGRFGPHWNVTSDLPVATNESGRVGCLMGRRGGVDDMMFGI